MGQYQCVTTGGGTARYSADTAVRTERKEPMDLLSIDRSTFVSAICATYRKQVEAVSSERVVLDGAELSRCVDCPVKGQLEIRQQLKQDIIKSAAAPLSGHVCAPSSTYPSTRHCTTSPRDIASSCQTLRSRSCIPLQHSDTARTCSDKSSGLSVPDSVARRQCFHNVLRSGRDHQYTSDTQCRGQTPSLATRTLHSLMILSNGHSLPVWRQSFVAL
ncbi:hypothetical protein CBL_04005 [Carabus blaptoides fortunei]